MSAGSKRLLVVGAGGHAKVVVEVARAAGWTPVAAVDRAGIGEVLGVPIRGTDESIAPLWESGEIDAALVAIGDNNLRHRLATRVRALECPTPSIVHPSALISPSARIDNGTVIMAGAIINASASVGRDCIVNTAAVIEHDCILGEAVHAAPRSVMGGSCSVGRLTLFGIGATARPGVRIGSQVVVGAGAAIVSDIPDGWVVGGTPARRIRIDDR